ncbi:hypothetical protein PPTG_12587 [Phytophthora nicotianae INRA-310]|uniref:Uncharacterized protein n=1 Tax=Phytophthora nicotianae (strain INRA-310) TaxID=761204 RepID=W2Q2G1_PHYN3|nr:hypothetical protein PPTG_12587 [Phytophthora nicotianae INRA-310]ETN06465.1 hypothetical protein PPTG_12587 [Phytophthora nicotianae INRA-310]
MASISKMDYDELFQLDLPAKKGFRQPYTAIEVARMVYFAQERMREDGDIPRAVWKIAAANNVTNHSADSMDSHYRKNLRNLTEDQRQKLMADAAATLRATMLPEKAQCEFDPESKLKGDANSAVVVGDTEVHSIISRICRDTGQDKLAVAHALYFYSGCIENTVAFLNGGPPGSIWCDEDDKILTSSLALQHVSEFTIAEAERRGSFAGMKVPRTNASIMERALFLK